MLRSIRIWNTVGNAASIKVAALLAVAAMFDFAVALAAGTQQIAPAAAVILHLAFVAAVAYALALTVWPALNDQGQFAVVAMLFAGPFGTATAIFALFSDRGEAEADRAPPIATQAELPPDPVEELVAQLRSGRSISETAPIAESLLQLMKVGSVREQLAVLGVVAQNYHPSHKRILALALRAQAGGVRAQAAALVTSLGMRYKKKYDRVMFALKTGTATPAVAAADLLDCLNSRFLEAAQMTQAREAAIGACSAAIKDDEARDSQAAERLRRLLADLNEVTWEQPDTAPGATTGRPGQISRDSHRAGEPC